MDIQKRPATEADIPFLLSLRRETMNSHLVASGASISDECHLDRLKHQFDCAEVLIAGNQSVGLVKIKRLPGIWTIVQIQLTRELRGKGVGSSLLEAIIGDASVAGADVKLGVLKANPARHLYERLGFRIVGQDDHEYFMHRGR